MLPRRLSRRVALRVAVPLALVVAALRLAACAKDDAPADRPPAPSYTADGSIEGVKPTSRPSIVIVDVAGVRYDAVVPAAGKPPLLPGLARLLLESTSFDNAISAAGWDVPALASLLTGIRASDHQIVGVYGGLASELNPSWPTLAEILRAQGWRTAAFGRRGSTLRAFGLAQGFDAWDEAWTGGDEAGLAKVTAWLSGPAPAAAALAPAFLFLRPTLVMPEMAPGSADAPLDLDRARAAYAEAARALDAELARLLEALHRSPATRDAILVVTASHGYALGESDGRVGPGMSVRDEVIHVPLAISAPGLPRVRVAGSCSLIDVTPTLLALVGMPPPPMAGYALGALAARPTAAGLPAEAQDWAPLALKPPGVRRLHALRTAKAKYVARLHATSKTWDEQFYDLGADPGEAAPLAKPDLVRLDADLAAAVARMREYLEGRVQHYRDVEKAGYFMSDD